MNNRTRCLFIVLACLIDVCHVAAQGTAFTYQGKLDANGGAANGLYDFLFRLDADRTVLNIEGHKVAYNCLR